MGCMSPLSAQTICPRCGYDATAPYDPQYKKPGSLIAERYTVGRLHKKNGESAVYLGYDCEKEKKVWIREYFPHTFATRAPITGAVFPFNGHEAQFKALLSDFVDVCNEVRRMSVTEPVVPIEDVVEQDGTTYAIYRHLQVQTLERWLQTQGGILPAIDACDLFLPLFNALSNLHSRGIIHRGISPYTIYIDADNHLYMGDFCVSAARTGGSELEAELFNGYSAPEQYTSTGWQGTWTDVYSAGALLYRTITGFVPPKATLISPQRPLAALRDLVDDPSDISDAVAAAMNPNTELRTQQASIFVAQLIQTDMASTAIYDTALVHEVKKDRERQQEEEEEKKRIRKYMIWGLVVTVTILIISLSWVAGSSISKKKHDANQTSDQSQTDGAPDDATDGPIVLPDFVGESIESIQQEYGQIFKIEVQSDYHAKYEEDIVYDQSPAEGTKLLNGRTLILYVSKGKRTYTMPDLTGMTLTHALEELNKLTGEDQVDLMYSTYPKHSDRNIPTDTVLSTTPAAGTEFDPKNVRISIFVQASQTSANEAMQVEKQLPTYQQDDSSSAKENSPPSDSWRSWAMNNP